MSVKLCSLYTLEREPVGYELEIHYTYHPYVPARGPSYASGGEPEEYAFVEIDRIECDQVNDMFELTDAEEEGVLDWLLCEAQDEMSAPNCTTHHKACDCREAYRGWSIEPAYYGWQAVSPNYDASWEGEEDGWVDNGEKAWGRTREECEAAVDEWLEEHDRAADQGEMK